MGHVPGGPAARILWLEDEQHAIAGTIQVLRSKVGAVVEIVKHVAGAETTLRSEKWDFFLVDVHVPLAAKRTPSLDAGQRLLERLKGGELGPRNRDVPFAILTAHSVALQSKEVQALPGCRGIFDKLEQVQKVVKTISEVLDDRVDATPDSAWRTQVEVVESDGDFAYVVVPAWEPQARVAVSVKEFPKKIWRIISANDLPLWLTAYVHLGADELDELRPFGFELAPETPGDDELGF